MEFYPLVRGNRLPEVYHFGFNGTHFEIYLNPTYWLRFVELAGPNSHYSAGQGPTYVPPRICGGAFGQHGCALASNTLEGFMCIQVPANVEDPDEENPVVSMRVLGRTLANILFMLMMLLHDLNEKKENAGEDIQQLFVLETFISLEQGFHGAGIEFTVSPRARKYFQGLGKDFVFEEAMAAKRDHYLNQSRERRETLRFLYSNDFMVRLREYGTLDMKTMGNCACLGTMPKDFGDEGYTISSHNVDTVSQQFNLLVGIAYVWQMVRGCVRLQDK